MAMRTVAPSSMANPWILKTITQQIKSTQAPFNDVVIWRRGFSLNDLKYETIKEKNRK
jgi:hypothetical protein